MKMKIEVKMPRKLAIETDLLADLLGANTVYRMFQDEKLEAGQRNYEWYKRNGGGPTSADDDAPLTDEEEKELARMREEIDRGLEA